ncbi:hypothetical protein BCR44DRAFT_1068427 [Catenaria anguillulae PL171]|uniref:Alpha-aminoadipate reductase n=1 Tax=Catenaria anguillulae PL171 TaxID=765915 RepID=A0A1Y2HPV4_9FUNG|nr:hypothetical protein BCR44DRAFT_1068427 [Catenaria anguillulae PL171]
MNQVVDVEHHAATVDPIPFARLVSALATTSSSQHGHGPHHHQPLFKVRFFNTTDTNPALLSTQGTATDLTIFITTSPSLRTLLPIHVRIAYNACLFSPQRMADMADQLTQVLEAATSDASTPIGSISLVTPSMRARLPDPTLDLHWDQWPGAICDVFEANALRNPDATCVVDQVEDGSNKRRVFTYQQINNAASRVANALIQGGIQREDVVMLYSARCVELVVAIMGVLRAGATFSVIDPAYPPQRQCIYLSVAQPRGLIILSRAGQLDASVREYISTQLHIVCELSPLHLESDGSVPLLAHVPASNPGIVLGPDSIGTLSFTSGSTGVPKGVKGRHFSLTHYYPWLASHFGLTSRDRFTMLSGIAHDPIQRDIFTPLFLGAALHIPTADDIGTPGALARWMHSEQVSVTHLTPAMGQLVTSGVAAAAADGGAMMDTLRNAFFVGDILTKRDVARLQLLAPNCAVVNMYGTTETQRAVSYLRVPPRALDPEWLSTRCKEVVPAGQGMINVQLLVVNKAGKLAGVGEIGELYVRAGGLAEGYLGLPEATAEKFLANPFAPAPEATTSTPASIPYFKGPRDRMYRTGDLGRFLPTGHVECSGRADDQIKIRGFRIELGEIDMYLSQHARVRENVTLVRRDKDEEMTLVSYLVLNAPETNEADAAGKEIGVGKVHYVVPQDWASVQSDIRAWLRSKLPAYAVPAVICPLRAMPLTPNGKVDKNALPFPDTGRLMSLAAANPTAAAAHADTSDDRSRVARDLRGVWAKVLRVPEDAVQWQDNFFDIGGHSVLATRLVLLVRREFGLPDAPLALVFDTPVLGDMATRVEAWVDEQALDVTAAVAAPAAGGVEAEGDKENVEFDYAQFADAPLPDEICVRAGARLMVDERPRHVVVTGATGFLGAFIVAQLLGADSQVKVTCVARAKSDADARARVVRNLALHACGLSDSSLARLEAVAGDLAQPQWGLSEATWTRLAADADAIVHNGAMVHWVYPYAKLAPANVAGTLEALKLATAGNRIKPVHFVSSTSVLDTPHFTQHLGGAAVHESDPLHGSRSGLRSGYAQTKWVAERLCARASKERGVPVTVVRPGYIVGHSQSGVTNADDFIWRLVKGCIELGACPDVTNVVNMCPVDYVASVVVALTLGAGDAQVSAPAIAVNDGGECESVWAPPHARIYGRVYHTFNPENFRFVDLLAGSLTSAWPSVKQVPYLDWRAQLLERTMADGPASALFPLLHFVLDDLPTATRAPALDTSNTRAVLGEGKGRCRACAREYRGRWRIWWRAGFCRSQRSRWWKGGRVLVRR